MAYLDVCDDFRSSGENRERVLESLVAVGLGEACCATIG